MNPRLWIVGLLLVLSALSAGAQPQEAAPKRVLLISTGSRLAPGFILVDQQILRALRAPGAPRVDIFAENLDVIRFPAERSQHVFREYLTAKYAEHPPDVVVLVFVGTLGVTATVLEDIFPGKPIIAAGFTEEDFTTQPFGPNVSGFAQRVDPAGTFELMMRLQPDLERVVVIGGTADIDRHLMQRVRTAAQPYDGRVAIEFWDNLRMQDIRERVQSLPRRTAVLYARLFRDAAGQSYVSSEVGQWLGGAANGPVYIMSDTHIGTGAIGGSISSAELFGQRAGALALQVLGGTPVSAVPFEIRTDAIPTFDARALKRWGIAESALPPGSVVRYKQATVWGQYRWHIAGVLVVILIQSAMIVALIAERRHRRQAQEALDENQEFMALATEAGEIGLWSRDVAHNTLWMNASLRSTLGIGDEEVAFGDIVRRIHPDDQARVTAEVERAQAQGLPFEAEYRILSRNGAERWVLTRGRTMTGLDGRETRRMGVVLDITARKRAEERLRENLAELVRAERSLDAQRAFLRQVIDLSPNFIFAKDRAGRFTLANRAVAEAYGCQVYELIGRTDAEFNRNAEEVEFFRRMDLEVMDRREERFIAEERITDARGNVRWMQTVKRPLVGADGRANQVIGASTDITERKRTERELMEQRAQLAHVSRVSLMGELAASLAHELNQPLTAILSNARAAQRFMTRETFDPADIREILDDIVAANNRAAEVIRQMRRLVKKEEQPELSTLSLADVVREVAALVHSDAVMQDIRIAVDVEPGLPHVRGDRVQLQQVVLNLLLNAFDAIAECQESGRDVELSARRIDGETVRVAVADRGPGLASGEESRIFEPFYTTKREGLGMGLSICRSIIQAHGGKLWAQNNPERGATFYFTVPLQRA